MSFPDCHLSRQARDERERTATPALTEARESVPKFFVLGAGRIAPGAQPEIGFSAPSLTNSLAGENFYHPLP